MNEQHNGLAKKVRDIILDNPEKIFCVQDIKQYLKNKYRSKSVSLAIRRLYHKGLVIRTPTQLAKGFYYSKDNKNGLIQIYKKYMLPEGFHKKEVLAKLLQQQKFKHLESNNKIDFNPIKDNKFVTKYGIKHFQEQSTQEFLAKLVGFCMCDAHIKKNKGQIHFFFRYKNDAEKFLKDFKKIFCQEYLGLTFQSYCYRVGVCGKNLVNLLHQLGAPIGNKINQPFIIPHWIYLGQTTIKKKFLSIVIGNEGSAPSNNRWRIQFVLSKNKENVLNLIEFQNQIRRMLYHFRITTSHIQLRKQEGRQYHGRFYIKGKENLHKFYNLLEFSYASEKQEVLEKLILEGNSFRSATAL